MIFFFPVILASIWVIVCQIALYVGQFKIYENGIQPTSLLYNFIPFSDIVDIEETGSRPSNFPVLCLEKRGSIRKYRIGSRWMRHVDEIPEEYFLVKEIILKNYT